MNIAPLAYRSVLAHLLPGVVGVIPVSAYVPLLRNTLDVAAAGKAESGISTIVCLVGAALVIGLCLDAIRYVSMDLILNRVFYGADSLRYMKNVRSEADLKFYDSVIDTSYSFYQFYTNTALALGAMLVVWEMGGLDKPPEGAPLLAGGLILVLLAAGLRATHGSAKRILYRFGPSITKENDMSNGPGHPAPDPPLPIETPLPSPPASIREKDEAQGRPKLAEAESHSSKETSQGNDAARS